MKSFKKNQISIFVGLALLATGCATPSYQSTKTVATRTTDTAQMAYATTQAISRPISKESNKFWVSRDAVLVKDENLPEFFNNSIQINFEPKTSLREAAATMSRSNGLRFSFASDVQADSDKPLLLTGFKQTTTLKGFLQQVSSLSSPAMSWQFKDGQVEFFRTLTKVFPLNIPTTDNEFNADISTKNQAGGGGGSSSSTGHTVKLSSKLNYWDNVSAEISPMLTPGLGKIVVSRSTGNVTVTDTPQALAAVSTYIGNLNETALRRVYLNIQVITVQNTKMDSYGVDWSGVYNVLASKYSLSLATPMLPSSLTSAAGTISAIIKPGSGNFATSSAMMAALSEQGMTTKIASYPQWTMSGIPTHTAVNKSKAYVSSTTVTPATVVGAAPAISMATSISTTGISLHTLARVINSNTVQIEESIEISSLDKLASFGPSSSQIQLPEESHMAYLPITTLKNGETLVLAGMDALDATVNQSGVGDSENSFIVGSTGMRSGNKGKSTVIILITPHLM